MIRIAVSNVKLLEIIDETTKETFYGSNQEWYRSAWQRLSGCGPSTVSNIVYYLSRTGKSASTQEFGLTRSEFLKLMEGVWKHVTPTIGGINSTKLLCKGVDSYARAKEIHLPMDVLDIPRNRSGRPMMNEVVSFLAQALEDDMPVAFLNLHNGGEALLDSWHWVTVVALEYDPLEEKDTYIDFADAGVLRHINLAQWLDSTNMGGGFVRFKR